MQIGNISKIHPTASERAALEAQPKAKASSSSAAQMVSTTSLTPDPAAVLSSSSVTTQNSSSDLRVTKLAATDSTTVAGKTYPESIEFSGGEYIVSVPSPPGVRASGLSEVSAENNLNVILDTLI